MLGAGIIPPGSILMSLTGMENIRRCLDWRHKSGERRKECVCVCVCMFSTSYIYKVEYNGKKEWCSNAHNKL